MPSLNIGRWKILLIGIVIIGSAAVFLPGQSGPLIFDDYSNLIENSYVKVTTLDVDTLRRAAYSLDAGPFQRPVAMLTFALNHYWAGSFTNTTPFKLTNIAIHAVNGLLIFWLTYLVLQRIAQIQVRPKLSVTAISLLACTAAVMWVVHPMQVSSALYIVQRMTELAAFFSLLALNCYLIGRRALLEGKRWAPWLLVGAPLIFGVLGMLSKENTILLPLFIGVLEFVLYGSERPWTRWDKLALKTKRIIGVIVIAALVLGIAGAIWYALPMYAYRQFTISERVLTEARVVWFYLSLILIPRLNQFGHQHDDIEISTSLLNPWTTLPALFGHVAMLCGALLLHKRQPLIALGFLWFYVGHLLESTIFALEIAYEHRNYVPIVGPIWALIGLVELMRARIPWPHARWLLPVLTLAFGSIAALRAEQWRDPNSFYRYEASHHPESPRIQVGMSMLLEAHGRYAEAEDALRRAAELEPNEVGHLLHLFLITVRRGGFPTPAEQQRTLELLRLTPLSASAFLGLQHAVNCLQTWCKALQGPVETWAKTVVARDDLRDKSYYYYILGLSHVAQNKTVEAVNDFRLSYEADPAYLHPLFALASIYVQHRQLRNAELILNELERANIRVSHRRDKELAKLRRDIEIMRTSIASPNPPAPRP